MARELATARLEWKSCISEPAQCFHFEFVLDEMEDFSYLPGQFISAVAEDGNGKQQTRAYSIAAAPVGNHFELCVNRVEAGFFSNHLADLPDESDGLLPVGGKIRIHGPHGNFTLREPLTDSILVATGTGVAPMRAFLQGLFPEHGPDAGKDLSHGKEIWLVYGTRYESDLYYADEFEALAQRVPNFHFLPTLSRAAKDWTGLRGHVQEHVARIIQTWEKARSIKAMRLQTEPRSEAVAAVQLTENIFDIHAYICGLNEMVTGVRELLNSLGWHRKQIIYERYD